MKYLLMILVLSSAPCNRSSGPNAGWAGARRPVPGRILNGFTNVILLSLVLLLFCGFPSLGLFKAAPWWAYFAGRFARSSSCRRRAGVGGAILVALFVAGQVGARYWWTPSDWSATPADAPAARLIALALIVIGDTRDDLDR